MMTNSALKNLDIIAQAMFDKKGINIIAFDIRDTSSLTDFVIVGEGNVDRHVQALSDNIIDVLEESGEHPLHVEGMQTGDWVVLDYGDFMVHLFTSELRDKYRIEQLWQKSKIIDLNIKLDPVQGK